MINVSKIEYWTTFFLKQHDFLNSCFKGLNTHHDDHHLFDRKCSWQETCIGFDQYVQRLDDLLLNSASLAHHSNEPTHSHDESEMNSLLSFWVRHDDGYAWLGLYQGFLKWYENHYRANHPLSNLSKENLMDRAIFYWWKRVAPVWFSSLQGSIQFDSMTPWECDNVADPCFLLWEQAHHQGLIESSLHVSKYTWLVQFFCLMRTKNSAEINRWGDLLIQEWNKKSIEDPERNELRHGYYCATNSLIDHPFLMDRWVQEIGEKTIAIWPGFSKGIIQNKESFLSTLISAAPSWVVPWIVKRVDKLDWLSASFGKETVLYDFVFLLKDLSQHQKAEKIKGLDVESNIHVYLDAIPFLMNSWWNLYKNNDSLWSDIMPNGEVRWSEFSFYWMALTSQQTSHLSWVQEIQSDSSALESWRTRRFNPSVEERYFSPLIYRGVPSEELHPFHSCAWFVFQMQGSSDFSQNHLQWRPLINDFHATDPTMDLSIFESRLKSAEILFSLKEKNQSTLSGYLEQMLSNSFDGNWVEPSIFLYAWKGIHQKPDTGMELSPKDHAQWIYFFFDWMKKIDSNLLQFQTCSFIDSFESFKNHPSVLEWREARIQSVQTRQRFSFLKMNWSMDEERRTYGWIDSWFEHRALNLENNKEDPSSIVQGIKPKRL